MGLQPLTHGVAGSSTYGCRLEHIRLQASMRQLSAKARSLEARRDEAGRRGQKMGGVFVAQLGSARSLAEIQQRFVNEQLKQAPSAPSSLTLTPTLALTPTLT